MRLPDGVIILNPGESSRPGHLILKASGEQTNGAYALRENTIEPGFMVGPHRHHKVDEAWFVIEGEMTFLVEHHVVSVPSGGFVFVPRALTHAFTNRCSVPTHFVALFSPPGFEDMFEELLGLGESGRLNKKIAADIRARYETEDVEVPAGIWPPAS